MSELSDDYPSNACPDEPWHDPDGPECGGCGEYGCVLCGGPCHYCEGDGWGILDGELQQCPCCGGTGDGKDCKFW